MQSNDSSDDTELQVPAVLRFQVASDVHTEFIKRRLPDARIIQPAKEADILVLAGDIANGLDAVAVFGDWPVPDTPRASRRPVCLSQAVAA